jgi:hypothetical protein
MRFKLTKDAQTVDVEAVVSPKSRSGRLLLVNAAHSRKHSMPRLDTAIVKAISGQTGLLIIALLAEQICPRIRA